MLSYAETPPMRKKVFFTIPLFIQKDTKNLDFCSILASQTLPNPSQIESKRPLGRLLGPLGNKASKKEC